MIPTTLAEVAFHAFLLSQMRARDAIANAVGTLGLSSSDVEALAADVSAHGVMELGGRAQSIERFLGRQVPVNTGRADTYQALVRRFPLALWPMLDFCVWTSLTDVVGCMGFLSRTPKDIGDPWHLVPWSVTESDLLVSSLGARLVVVDDWPPLRDYRCAPEGDISTVVLRFDFGLLQEVAALNEP